MGDSGHVFTTATGKPVGPDRLTRLFRRLVTARLPSRLRAGRPEGRADLVVRAWHRANLRKAH